MKVVQIDDYGPADRLVPGTADQPSPAAGQVVIAVAAIGVNPADAKWRSGLFRSRVPLQFPYIPGYDVAGRIDAIGDDVLGFRPGDRVFAMLHHRRAGAYAEFAVAAAATLVRIPDALTDEAAAALPTPGLTGQQLIEDALAVEPGQVVAITGAAGAVGRAALWAAKRRGAFVIAAIRDSQRAAVTALGADATIVLGQEDWTGAPIDCLCDTVGGVAVADLARRLAPGGRIRTAATTPIPAEGLASPPEFFAVHADAAGLARLAEAAAAGALSIPIARILPLDRAAEAHRLLEAGGLGGKIILKP